MLNATFSVIFKHCVHPFQIHLRICMNTIEVLGTFKLDLWSIQSKLFFALKSNFYSVHLYFSFFALTQGVFADFLAFSNYWGKNCSEATERILKSPKYFCLTLFENYPKCLIWILAFITNFCPHPSGFQKLSKIYYCGHF